MTVEVLQHRTHGIIFDTITRQTFKLVDTTVPPAKMAEAFESVVEPIVNRILGNLHESLTLVALRDKMLPKLNSGDAQVEPRENHLKDEN